MSASDPVSAARRKIYQPCKLPSFRSEGPCRRHRRMSFCASTLHFGAVREMPWCDAEALMRHSTLRAYLTAVAFSAAAMDLSFFVWSGAYASVEGPADFLWLPVFWLGTVAVVLIGSFVPAAVMAGISKRFEIRSLLFFVGWSCAASLVLAVLVAGLAWSPDVPPQDPDYLTFPHLLRRVAGLFASVAAVGGVTYWAVAGRGSDTREG